MSEEDSEIVETGKAGRPSKYSPAMVDRLLASLAAGLTQKQACVATGICENTLSAWRKEHPDLQPRMDAAREVARQTALEGIKTAGEKDWRALAEWLKLTFPEYRSGHNVNVSATANAQQATVVCTEEHRKRLQEKLARWQLDQSTEEALPAKAAPIALPAPQTQSTDSQGAGNGSPEAVVKPAGEPVGPFRDLGPNDNYEPPQEEPSGPSVGW